MKFFLTLLLLLGSCLGAWAGEEENETFKYLLRTTSKDIYITQYKGNDKTLIIPREIVAKDGESYPVTRINSLMASSSTKITEEVFIPSSIENICSSADLFNPSQNKQLKTIIFEDDGFTINHATNKPVNLTTLPNPIVLDNIIILSKSNRLTSDLINDGGKTFIQYYGRVGHIKIKYSDKEEIQYVRMYLKREKNSQTFTFNNERLGYLLSALEKSGKNLSEIEEIDLSEMSNKEANIVFEDLSLPETCSNAHLITNTIEDLTNYEAPATDQVGFFAYSRTNTQDWNSVCLPFPIRESDFPEGTKIYTMTGGSEEKILLTRIGQDDLLAAGTPCFISSVAETWDLNINATIPANIAPASETQDGNSWVLKGCFSEIELGTGKYKLNSAGSEFVRTTENSHAWPFRCYLEPKNNGQGAPARLSVGVDEEASITLVPNDAEPQTVKLIDLMGRPRQGNAPGLYIRAKH